MENTKQERLLEIFLRGIRGNGLSVRGLADEYGVSTKSITRNINDLKAFLVEHREMTGNLDLRYNTQDSKYYLYTDEFLTSKELFALLEVLIGTRAFAKEELMKIINKLQQFTVREDRLKMKKIIQNEIYHYAEIKHDCKSVEETLWNLINAIVEKKEISIEYYRMDRKFVTHRLRPASVLFSDYYFYLIAFKIENDMQKPYYFRVDRISRIMKHRTKFDKNITFDEGGLRNRSLFMQPGKLRIIRFEFTGPSVQAVLDKLPTARVIECNNGKNLIEAEVYGDGIKMWLLSQGHWVKVLEPEDFLQEMKEEIEKMAQQYDKE